MHSLWTWKRLALLALALLWSCGGESSNSFQYARWSFTGTVLDGTSNRPLAGVSIHYLDIDGDPVTATSDADGNFFIEGLPYGQKAFRFEYSEVSGSQSRNFTPRLLQAGSVVESSSMEGILATSTKIVKLYPLDASLQVSIHARDTRTGLLQAADSVWVRVVYQDSTFLQTDSSQWRLATDSLGMVQFSALPADTMLQLIVERYQRSADRYLPTSTALPRLQSGLITDMGALVLKTDTLLQSSSALYAVASNLWRDNDHYLPSVSLYDTLWVKFSKPLHSNLDRLRFEVSTASRSLYINGAKANASAWVAADTLFLVPDQRVDLVSATSIGFKVSAVSAEGVESAPLDFTVDVVTSPYSVIWTNTRDQLGINRRDLRTTDSIVVVSSVPFESLLGVTGVASTQLPPGVQASDFTVRGDTIIYHPRLAMLPGVQYGMDFSIQSSGGQVLTDVLPVQWSTAYQVSILSVDNRDAMGYRRFKSLGDSLTVSFSQPIDTVAQPFVVHMTDVKGSAVQTRVRWDATRTQAIISNLTALPTADFGDYSTLSTQGKQALAVRSVSFDFQTNAGEVVSGLVPSADSIRIYTEQGLAVVGTNILANHAEGYEVLQSELPITDFPVDGAVQVRFNRTLDTTYMRSLGLAVFAGLQTAAGTQIATTIDFANEGQTLIITPNLTLTDGGSYHVWLKKVPALAIRQAEAIGQHAGTFSGKNLSYQLLATAFQARVP